MNRLDLTVQGGYLYLGERLLVYHYPEGDRDLIGWPLTRPRHLAGALFDEGNTGEVFGPVYLPDGSHFGDLAPCGFVPVDPDHLKDDE